MKINTAHFGEVEIDEKSVIHFEEGIPGFENLKKFVVLKDTDTSSFSWLQSVEASHAALPVANPFDVKHDYEFEIDTTTKNALNINSENEVAVLAVTTIPNKISRMSVNLNAPIIINTVSNKARQMVMNNGAYETKHYILEEMVNTTYNAVKANTNK